jgi:hypothetical protein
MSSAEIDHLSLPFIDLYVPAITARIHYSESTLQFAEDMTFVFLCRINTGTVHEQSKISSRHHDEGIIYI